MNAQFSFFGSVLTIGGLVGAALSGRFADLFGRRGVNLLIFVELMIMTKFLFKKTGFDE